MGPLDVLKITLTTQWGTFIYVRTSFKLVNVRATFHRAMDYTFVDIKDVFIVIYLDDLIFYSRRIVDHLKHLRQVFERWKKFGISLNPKKFCSGKIEGKWLGHIVATKGVKINLDMVEGINTISLSRHKKALQSFFGRIDFLWIFIPNFSKLTK